MKINKIYEFTMCFNFDIRFHRSSTAATLLKVNLRIARQFGIVILNDSFVFCDTNYFKTDRITRKKSVLKLPEPSTVPLASNFKSQLLNRCFQVY
jgi:hypothetical protein